MGIGDRDLRLLIHLKSTGLIPDGSAVVEIGAQQLSDTFLACGEELEIIGRLFCVDQPCPLPPPLIDAENISLDPAAPWARDFWTWLGLDYAAIDIDGSLGSLTLDLNYDDVPPEWTKRFHVVTNFGTTEHIVNQLNAFKIVHDLAALGGVMIHHVPAQGMFNHGLVSYNPKFFWMLARSNIYKWLHMEFLASNSSQPLSPNIVAEISRFVPDFAERIGGYEALDCGLTAAMQKIVDISFVAPIDVNTGTRAENKLLEERYWTVFKPDAIEELLAGEKQTPSEAESQKSKT
jgi:hypothetical protein